MTLSLIQLRQNLSATPLCSGAWNLGKIISSFNFIEHAGTQIMGNELAKLCHFIKFNAKAEAMYCGHKQRWHCWAVSKYSYHFGFSLNNCSSPTSNQLSQIISSYAVVSTSTPQEILPTGQMTHPSFYTQKLSVFASPECQKVRSSLFFLQPSVNSQSKAYLQNKDPAFAVQPSLCLLSIWFV